MKKKQISIIAAIMVLTSAVTFTLTYITVWRQFDKRLTTLNEKEAIFEKLTEINSYIDNLYIMDYDPNESADAMAAAMMASLPDGWSYYYSKDQMEYKQAQENLEYAGIGANCALDVSGYVQILEVYADSPAMKAGLRYGDIIVEVNGEDTAELGLEGTVSKVKGEAGTSVVLTVYKYGRSEYVDITVTRGIVHETELSYEMLDNEIGYVSIKHFSEGVQDSFALALEDLKEAGAKGIVFDVRMNSGGFMHVMADMLDKLMGEGTIIETRDRNGKTDSFESDDEKLDIPITVLVHEYSYSAAEFFAAVLQEVEGAKLIGRQTVGKGYAQNMFTLSDGSAIGLSVEEYYLPSGRSLKDGGVMPDYDVELTIDQLRNLRVLARDEDPQLVKAIEVLKDEINQNLS